MMTLAAHGLALAGFATLALSMQKHHRDLFGKLPSRRRALVLHCMGWALLGLSFAACILHSGWSTGPVLWFGVLTIAALITALTLTYRPQPRHRSYGRPRSASPPPRPLSR